MEQILPTLADCGLALLNFLNNLPPQYYVGILATIPFSFLVAYIKSFIKRRWDKTPSETKMVYTNIFGIILIAASAYRIGSPEYDPLTAISSLSIVGYIVQQPVFFRFVKPAIILFWQTWDKGKMLNDELKSAAVPAEGLPIE